jgi:hypothetical protein
LLPSDDFRSMALATLALALAIGFLTLMPITNAGVPGSDKLHHALAFAALTLPLSISMPRLTVWITLAAIADGGVIELVQPVVGRSREIQDFLADAGSAALGSVTGTCIRWSWMRLRS